MKHYKHLCSDDSSVGSLASVSSRVQIQDRGFPLPILRFSDWSHRLQVRSNTRNPKNLENVNRDIHYDDDAEA